MWIFALFKNTTSIDVTLPPLHEPMIVEEDSFVDVTPQAHEYNNVDNGSTYEIVDSSIRGKNKLYSNLGFFYIVKTRNGTKLSSVCVCVCVDRIWK